VPRELLIVLCLLIVIGGLLIIIVVVVVVVVVVGSMSGTDANSSQLTRSQQGIGVRDGWVDGHVRELKKCLIPLTMNDLLVASDDLNVLLHHLHTLICATAHGKDTPEHLRDAKVGARGGGGAGRSHNWSRRAFMMSPWILEHYVAKRVMLTSL
jgi:hypothetical protein